jgi:hypothetical protein
MMLGIFIPVSQAQEYGIVGYEEMVQPDYSWWNWFITLLDNTKPDFKISYAKACLGRTTYGYSEMQVDILVYNQGGNLGIRPENPLWIYGIAYAPMEIRMTRLADVAAELPIPYALNSQWGKLTLTYNTIDIYGNPASRLPAGIYIGVETEDGNELDINNNELSLTWGSGGDFPIDNNRTCWEKYN